MKFNYHSVTPHPDKSILPKFPLWLSFQHRAGIKVWADLALKPFPANAGRFNWASSTTTAAGSCDLNRALGRQGSLIA